MSLSVAEKKTGIRWLILSKMPSWSELPTFCYSCSRRIKEDEFTCQKCGYVFSTCKRCEKRPTGTKTGFLCSMCSFEFTGWDFHTVFTEIGNFSKRKRIRKWLDELKTFETDYQVKQEIKVITR